MVVSGFFCFLFLPQNLSTLKYSRDLLYIMWRSEEHVKCLRVASSYLLIIHNFIINQNTDVLTFPLDISNTEYYLHNNCSAALIVNQMIEIMFDVSIFYLHHAVTYVLRKRKGRVNCIYKPIPDQRKLSTKQFLTKSSLTNLVSFHFDVHVYCNNSVQSSIMVVLPNYVMQSLFM